MIGMEVPFVDTPSNITVIRFTQLGMPVKSIEVPEVVACSVLSVSPTSTSEIAVFNCASVKLPRIAALPVEVTCPVRFALVVTLPAVRPAAVPVQLVRTPDDGVPSAGVVSVGEVSVGEVSVGEVSVLFVSVSVVSRPTIVSDES